MNKHTQRKHKQSTTISFKNDDNPELQLCFQKSNAHNLCPEVRPYFLCRQARRKITTIDMSVYDGIQANVVNLSFVERFPVSASKFKQRTLADRVEEVREKRRKQRLTKFFIRHNKADTSMAETFFKNYENFTISNMMNQVNGIRDIELHQLLRVDPIGIKDPDYDDSDLYLSRMVMQVADTTDASEASVTTPTGYTTSRHQ